MNGCWKKTEVEKAQPETKWITKVDAKLAEKVKESKTKAKPLSPTVKAYLGKKLREKDEGIKGKGTMMLQGYIGFDEEEHAEEITKLSGIEISFGNDIGVINLDETAKRYTVSLEALKEVIKGQSKPDYSLLGDQLVSNRVLYAIRGELERVKGHDDALRIFARYGIRAHIQVLAFLGYKVKLSGLNLENAEILKA